MTAVADTDPESALLPFEQPSFRAGLAALAASAAEASRRWAADAEVLARLAAAVPRSPGDERGGTPWTSFLREVAVARRTSDRAAVTDVRQALLLVAAMPRTLGLLRDGHLPVHRARALVDEVLHCDDVVAGAVDAEVAARAVTLPPARIRAAVQQHLLRLDADAAADRAARATSGRGVRKTALQDDQAEVVITGPAVALTAWFDALTVQARAARRAGDPRPLDALRFDLAVGQAWSPEAPLDARRARPVQVLVHVPVDTALGLSNEPGWLDGHGWVSAPQCRQLLPSAELRQVCRGPSGEVVDLADRAVRPPPTPDGVREALLSFATQPFGITSKTWRTDAQHDPPEGTASFVGVRDRSCDGPTGTRVPASRCDLDHEVAYPHGPTAAWNLVARSRRTHALKHFGWTPLRTPHSTVWASPAGQLVEVPRAVEPMRPVDPRAVLPDAVALHALEAELLREPVEADLPPIAVPA